MTRIDAVKDARNVLDDCLYLNTLPEMRQAIIQAKRIMNDVIVSVEQARANKGQNKVQVKK